MNRLPLVVTGQSVGRLLSITWHSIVSTCSLEHLIPCSSELSIISDFRVKLRKSLWPLKHPNQKWQVKLNFRNERSRVDKVNANDVFQGPSTLGRIFSIYFSFFDDIEYYVPAQDCNRVLKVRRGLVVSTVLPPPTSLKHRVIKTLELFSCGKEKKKTKW